MSEPSPLTPGLSGTAVLRVGDADTAIALRSGDVPVLGTPRVVALAEEAACAAVAGCLPADQTSVGIHVDLHHTQPSPIGERVTATATVEGVDGRRLDFAIRIVQGDQTEAEVARATHRRVIVPRAAFDG